MAIDIIIIILIASWIASLGLLWVMLAWHAQAEAAQENMAIEWALSRRKPHVGG